MLEEHELMMSCKKRLNLTHDLPKLIMQSVSQVLAGILPECGAFISDTCLPLYQKQ